jgi:hypothetical protein
MPTKKVLVIVNDDVAGELTIPPSDRFLPLQEALLPGEFSVIEVSEQTQVLIGQKYDGTNFSG